MQPIASSSLCQEIEEWWNCENQSQERDCWKKSEIKVIHHSPDALPRYSLESLFAGFRKFGRKKVRKNVRKNVPKNVRKMFEKCSKNVRKMFEKCSKNVRKMFGKCSKNVRKMFEKCSKNVRKMYEKCSKNVRKMSEKMFEKCSKKCSEKMFQKMFEKSPKKWSKNVRKNCSTFKLGLMCSLFKWWHHIALLRKSWKIGMYWKKILKSLSVHWPKGSI
jgi:uncharacterized protein (UPF0147 family)